MGITLYAKKIMVKRKPGSQRQMNILKLLLHYGKGYQLNAYLTLIYLHKKDYGKVIEFIEKDKLLPKSTS